MITLAVLDMAGTTIDEQGLVYTALRACVEATGAEVADKDLSTWMGRDKVESITALMRLGGQAPDEARVAAAFDDFRSRLAQLYATTQPQPAPGALKIFTALRDRGTKIYLTTGFDRAVVEPLLATLGWDRSVIDGWVCTEDVATGRPAPYMIYRAMERAGCRDVSEVLVAGDTVADVQAGLAARAGVTVAVTTADVPRAELLAAHPDAVVDRLDDILALPALSTD